MFFIRMGAPDYQHASFLDERLLTPTPRGQWIPFADVHAVRLTLGGTERNRESSIEILCDSEDIECPPTHIPRQEALYLAVTMNVRLIKVTDDGGRADRPDSF